MSKYMGQIMAECDCQHTACAMRGICMATCIEELEAKLAKALAGLEECEKEIDRYVWQEYPSDHPVHERYRQRDFSANPARTALATLGLRPTGLAT